MSDRSEQALRERLELAKKATPGPWKIFRGCGKECRIGIATKETLDDFDAGELVIVVDYYDDSGGILREADAAHIASHSPDVVRADLEEILALRAEVARLNREADWLALHLHRAGVPCPGDGDKFDPYGECAKKGWPCVSCFREWAKLETQGEKSDGQEKGN